MAGKRSRRWRSSRQCKKHSCGLCGHQAIVGWIGCVFLLFFFVFISIFEFFQKELFTEVRLVSCASFVRISNSVFKNFQYESMCSRRPDIEEGDKKHVAESKSNHEYVAPLGRLIGWFIDWLIYYLLIDW